MSVIIRLQNLPWAANSVDIRQYFRGLAIPDGGVNIVGGEKGDAFIAFSTDEDARQAMMLNGGKIKDSSISLLLSSRAEMQKVIEQARARTLSIMSGNTAAVGAAASTVAAPAAAAPLITTTANAKPIIPAALTQSVASLPQPPVISLSGFLASSLQRPETTRASNVIEIPGLTNGYTTTGASLLFNPNLPTNMPTIVDTTGAERDKIVEKYKLNEEDGKRSPRDSRGRRIRRSRSDSRDRSSSRSRSRSRDRHSPRRRRYNRSRSPRRSSRSPTTRRRYRSRERRYRRSSSGERSYESDKDHNRSSPPVRSNNSNSRNFSNIWEVPPQNPTAAQQSNSTPAFQPYGMHNFRTNMGASNLSTSDWDAGFSNREPPSGRDVFGREIRTDRAEEADACVKLGNLDKSTGYGEIRRLFSGLFITNNGIKMINDENGERTGIAYIRFAKRDDKIKALLRDGTVLRDKTISIVDVTDSDYESAIDSYRPSRRNDDRRKDDGSRDNFEDLVQTPFTCLKVTDLPPFAKEQDIIKMFSNFTIMQIVMGRNSKKIHEAYVKFYRSDDARDAMKEVPSFRMAHKFVVVSKCTDLEFEAARNEYECAEEDETMENGNGTEKMAIDNNEMEVSPIERPTDPRSASKLVNDPVQSPAPISSFRPTDPRAAIYNNINRDPRNRTNNSSQESPVVEYNSDSNQGNITPSQDSQASNSTTAVNRDPRRRVDPRIQAQLDNADCLMLSNLPTHLGEWDISEWIGETGVEPTKIHILNDAQRQPNGEALCEFTSAEQAKTALQKNNTQLENNTIKVEIIPRQRLEELINPIPAGFTDNGPPSAGAMPMPMNNGVPPMHNMRGGPSMPFTPGPGLILARPPMMNRPHFMPPGPHGAGLPVEGRVMLMENIPYKAATEDILEFFGHEFNLSPSMVMRRYNEKGQPAGEAKVLFHSSSDAKRAFNMRRGNKILNRTIYLKPM